MLQVVQSPLSQTDLSAFWSGRPYRMTQEDARFLIQTCRAEAYRGGRARPWVVCQATFVRRLRNELADMDPVDRAFFESALQDAGIAIADDQLSQLDALSMSLH